MCAQRIVWSGFRPFYLNADTENPYNPVELMAYVPFSTPHTVIRGIGVKVSDDDVSGFALWTAEIQENGELSEDSGPSFIPSVSIIEASVVLPAGMIAVAWGLKASNKNASNVVIWGRRWNSSTLQLEGSAIAYNFSGDNDVEMSTPVPDDPQQIIVGFGAGVLDNDVNRIAAGYASLTMSPASSLVPVIWGSVDQNGNPIAGSNFSSKRSGVGQYQLSWENHPNVVPVVGLTSGVRTTEDEGSDKVLSFSNVTTGGAAVTATDVGGSNNNTEDQAFSFVAFFPISDIPGLLFGTVDSNGDMVNGSSGWSAVRTGTGTYNLLFSRAMDPAPNLIMTSGVLPGEANGTDNVISNDIANTTSAKIYSQDVGDGSSNAQSGPFSFFVWNINVLPTDPITSQMKVVSTLSLDGENVAKSLSPRVTKDEDLSDVFSVVDNLGDGHWLARFNFPLPEAPILFASAVRTQGSESDGAKRIISFENVTTTSYELWSVKVGNGKHTPENGGLEVTVALPDQFPLP